MIGDEAFNLPEVMVEVRAAFDLYEDALRRHDTGALNDFFVQRADTARFGVAEHNYGAAEIASWRHHSPPVPAQRRLRNLLIVTYGADAASASAEFVNPDSTLLGRQSQTWIRTPGGWKIAAAHVSMIDAGLVPRD